MDGQKQLELPLGDIGYEAGACAFDAELGVAKARPPQYRPQRLRMCLIVADLLAIVAALAVATALQGLLRPVRAETVLVEVLLSLAALPFWLAIFGANRLFLARVTARRAEETRRILLSNVTAVGCLVGMSFVIRFQEMSRLWVALVFVVANCSILIERSVAREVFNKLRRSGRLPRPVVIVGTGVDGVALLHATERSPDLGYEVLGFTGDESSPHGAKPVFGSIEHTCDIVREAGATGVILSVSALNPDQVNRLTRELTEAGLHVALSSSLHDIDIARARSQTLDGRLMIYVEPTNRSVTRLRLKRVFDVVIAGLTLILAAPIIAMAAVAIKLTSPGPVLFRQTRVGLNGSLFSVLKLRTMVENAESLREDLLALNESDGPLFKMRSDPRVTRVGGFLRKASIDELPQLWNVIRGDMSIVGPRPALPAESAEWSPDLRARLRVLPGITGMWQVSGRSDADFETYRRLDLFYVDNWSLLHDLRIMVKTLFVVFLGRGAH